MTPSKWQAVYSNPEGESWVGPVRVSADAAWTDAEAHVRAHPFRHGQVIVIAVPESGVPSSQRLPPNPLARRTLKVPVTADALLGRWKVLERGYFAKAGRTYLIDIQPGGMATTDLPWRHGQQKGLDSWELLNNSSFGYRVNGGDAWVFSVMEFDGQKMQVYLDGYEQQAMTLERDGAMTLGEGQGSGGPR
jgi:hypothetical protein